MLRRAGHTEAAVDLARMAGMLPAGVLCEILNETGDRANRDQLIEMARRFDLAIISIEQLIATRRVREKLVYREAEAKLPTKYGTGRIIAYGVKYETQAADGVRLGDPTQVVAPLVRLHSSCFTGDLMDSLRCDCGDQLHMALDMIRNEGTGVLAYLPQEGRGIGLVERSRPTPSRTRAWTRWKPTWRSATRPIRRDYGVGIQLLKDLGLSKVRLLTNNPKKTDAFIYGGFDLEVVDQIPILPPINEHNARYLATKRDKMGPSAPAGLRRALSRRRVVARSPIAGDLTGRRPGEPSARGYCPCQSAASAFSSSHFGADAAGTVDQITQSPMKAFG